MNLINSKPCADCLRSLQQSGLFRYCYYSINNKVPKYLDRVVDSIPWNEFRVAGFTSTFQQTVASLALAARIKRRFPGVCTLFGGANFEGEMGIELVRSMDCIDYAVVGEGDVTLPEFLIALEEGRDPADVPGVIGRRNGRVTPLRPRPPLSQMDDLPIPDYEDFFERAEALGVLLAAERDAVDLPFEGARGCWWGQNRHCTFCGLNRGRTAFRSKSTERILTELTTLARRHHSTKFVAADNIINMSYIRDLFPRLAKAKTHFRFSYNVRANLTREQIAELHQGGVEFIQPGIESLSSPVLNLMRKGVTSIQNVNILRWAHYYGIRVGWNILWGFPGETTQDYREQASFIRLIVHLPPATHFGRIWMQRFSPIFDDRVSFPILHVRPWRAYTYLYPTHVALDRVAYFFEYGLEDTLPESAYERIKNEIIRWQSAWRTGPTPALTFWYASGLLRIHDLRNRFAPAYYTFREPFASVYVSCSDRPQTAASLEHLCPDASTVEDIGKILNEFCARGLMMRDGIQFLSLALPAPLEAVPEAHAPSDVNAVWPLSSSSHGRTRSVGGPVFGVESIRLEGEGFVPRYLKTKPLRV